MKDPYHVLGISTSATDDEIKSAYRKLAKQYHPDNYADNPLADIAEQKMKEINEAYDTITNARKNQSGTNKPPVYNYNYAKSTNRTGTQYKNIRLYINNDRLTEAQSLLDDIYEDERNAQWYFLQGMIYFHKSWAEQAYANFELAYNLDPTNLEYRDALEQLRRQRASGATGVYTNNSNFRARRKSSPSSGRSDCSCCNICSFLVCVDCCCDCLGNG